MAKKFVSYAKLSRYDVLMKQFVNSLITAANGDITALQSAIDLLNGADTESGSVAFAVKALADGAVKDNADAIDTLNGDESTEGSVAKAIKDYKDSIIYANTDDIDAMFADETATV